MVTFDGSLQSLELILNEFVGQIFILFASFVILDAIAAKIIGAEALGS